MLTIFEVLQAVEAAAVPKPEWAWVQEIADLEQHDYDQWGEVIRRDEWEYYEEWDECHPYYCDCSYCDDDDPDEWDYDNHSPDCCCPDCFHFSDDEMGDDRHVSLYEAYEDLPDWLR